MQAVPVPDASFHPSDAEVRMPPPPVVSVVIGDCAQPPQRPDTRDAEIQTDTDSHSVVEELKSLASWLVDRQHDTDDYRADGSGERNRSATVPADSYGAATTCTSSLAAGGQAAVSTDRRTAAGIEMGLHSSLGRFQPTEMAALGESKGAADLA